MRVSQLSCECELSRRHTQSLAQTEKSWTSVSNARERRQMCSGSTGPMEWGSWCVCSTVTGLDGSVFPAGIRCGRMTAWPMPGERVPQAHELTPTVQVALWRAESLPRPKPPQATWTVGVSAFGAVPSRAAFDFYGIDRRARGRQEKERRAGQTGKK